MKKEIITQSSLGELHQKEIDLIYLLRTKYKFGSIELVLRDGLPQDIVKTIERERLG